MQIEKIEKKQNQQRLSLVLGCILSLLTIVALAGMWAWSVSNVTSEITNQQDKMRIRFSQELKASKA
jgi:hypothetical protein